MGTEHISRIRALRPSSRFRPGLLFRRSWFALVTASAFSCVLYLLFTSAPLTFASQDLIQSQHSDPAYTQLSAGLFPTTATAMGSAPPPPPSVVREQRLSTVSSDNARQTAPPPCPTTVEPPAMPSATPKLAQTGQIELAEQAEQAKLAPETEPDVKPARPVSTVSPVSQVTTAPQAATENTPAVDEVAATRATDALSTAATPPPAGKADTPTTTAAAPSPTSPTSLANLANPAKAAPAKETRRLFGTVEMRASIRDLRQWQDVQKRHTNNPIFTSGFKLNSSTTWDKLKSMLEGKPSLEKIRGVNSFWNQWPYKLDIAGYGKEDYWAAPYEFRKNSGDCEDYAIVKYYTLKELGIPAEQMRIVVLKDTILNVAHAILAVYLEDDIYILDNIAKNVLSHTRIRNYLPVYSVNEQYRWVHVRTK